MFCFYTFKNFKTCGNAYFVYNFGRSPKKNMYIVHILQRKPEIITLTVSHFTFTGMDSQHLFSIHLTWIPLVLIVLDSKDHLLLLFCYHIYYGINNSPHSTENLLFFSWFAFFTSSSICCMYFTQFSSSFKFANLQII